VVCAETLPMDNAAGKTASKERANIKRIAYVRFIEFTKRSFCYVMSTYLFTFTVNGELFGYDQKQIIITILRFHNFLVGLPDLLYEMKGEIEFLS
jgi:hypothetical protein